MERGTGTAVKAVGKPIAGKTGTTNDWQDAWFVGFTPDLAAGVYIGYDDPDSLGDDETGGHIAAPVFRDFMIAALKDAPATAFRTPRGCGSTASARRPACRPAAGEPAIYEAYKPGTEPGQNRNRGLAARAERGGDAGRIDGRTRRHRAADANAAADAAADAVVAGAPASGTGGLY